MIVGAAAAAAASGSPAQAMRRPCPPAPSRPIRFASRTGAMDSKRIADTLYVVHANGSTIIATVVNVLLAHDEYLTDKGTANVTNTGVVLNGVHHAGARILSFMEL